MSSPSAQAQQSTREQCRVGDFVPVDFIPEWKNETTPQEFRAKSYDLSPMISGFGGTVPAQAKETWVFRRDDSSGWVRVS
jgi:hypothetical protein